MGQHESRKTGSGAGKPKFARNNESEKTMTFEMDGRFFNVPTIERRSQRRLTPDQAVARARNEGLLGKGFPTLETALASAQARTNALSRESVGGEAKDPKVTGGRKRRRKQLMGSDKPFNPFGKPPRGGGGRPKT